MDVKNLWFYSIFVITFGVALAFLYFYGYYMSFVILNYHRYSLADFYFSKITHLGDGITFTAIFYLMYGKNDIPKTLSLIICLIFSSFIVHLLKNFVFDDWFRPLVVFGNQIVNHIKGYEAYGKSFPSGHSTAIFTTLFCIVQWKNWNKIFQILWIFIGLSVGYSRIYLGVHFLGDVLMGIFIALVTSHLLFNFFSNRLFFLKDNLSLKKLMMIISVLSLVVLFLLRVIFQLNF